jgi:hypothetical protein
MARKCSYCGQEGHNILKCPLPWIHTLMKLLISSLIGSIGSLVFMFINRMYINNQPITMDFLSTLGNGMAIGFGLGLSYGIFLVLKTKFSLSIPEIVDYAKDIIRSPFHRNKD